MIGLWLALTVFGAVRDDAVSNRWLESFSIPGYSAYEANQRTLQHVRQRRAVAARRVITAPSRDVTKVRASRRRSQAAAQQPRRARQLLLHTHNAVYVSTDRPHGVRRDLPGRQTGLRAVTTSKPTRAALEAARACGTSVPDRPRSALRGVRAAARPGRASSEALIGGLGALVILLFVFGTLPAVAMPLLVAVASILNTFTLVWLLTYVTDVSIIVQFLIALVGLGIAIDYALLMIFRFREELRTARTSRRPSSRRWRTPAAR